MLNLDNLPESSSLLLNKLRNFDLRVSKLEGMRLELNNRKTEIAKKIAAAKGRQSLHKEISEIFEILQKQQHEKSVGSFEELLTSILNDVFPNEGSVKLNPEYKGNSTWLDINVERNGHIEDILEANGGALTNVISAGLRYIALIRSTNRRLLVLDEPDCWLKPERVTPFFKVLSEVSDSCNAQTFFVSHHKESYFEGLATIIELKRKDKEGGTLVNVKTPILKNWESEEEEGIRAIELINIRQHHHTIIPCFPGANAFIGDNNIGKSAALGAAFRAICYAEASESLVTHGCQSGTVRFHLEKGLVLDFIRQRDKSPALRYILRDKSGTEIKNSTPKSKGAVPDWVVELLNVKKLDDLDVQLMFQKSPVFLLDESAPTRASILSLGKEGSNLKLLMKEYSELRQSDNETISKGELELAALENRLKLMEGLDVLKYKLADLLFDSEDLQTDILGTMKLKTVIIKQHTIEKLSPSVALCETKKYLKLNLAMPHKELVYFKTKILEPFAKGSKKCELLKGVTTFKIPLNTLTLKNLSAGASCKKAKKAILFFNGTKFPAIAIPTKNTLHDLAAWKKYLHSAKKQSVFASVEHFVSIAPPLYAQTMLKEKSADLKRIGNWVRTLGRFNKFKSFLKTVVVKEPVVFEYFNAQKKIEGLFNLKLKLTRIILQQKNLAELLNASDLDLTEADSAVEELYALNGNKCPMCGSIHLRKEGRHD